MTPQSLLGQLTAIWYITDSYALNTTTNTEQDCATRRDVLPLVEHHLGKTDDLLGVIADNAGDVEVDDFIYADVRTGDTQTALQEAVEKMRAICMQPGTLALEDFVDATSDNLSDTRFAYVGSALSIALAVDEDVPAEYWDQAREDGLTPLQAAEQI